MDASVTVNCDKASGDTFPLGTTTVTCSATDAAGNKAEGSFKVTVVAARDTTAPTAVFSTTPGNNGTMTNRASNVTATFSEDVQNVNATTFKLEQVKVSRKGVETTSPVAATVTPASGTVAQGASATLNPRRICRREAPTVRHSRAALPIRRAMRLALPTPGPSR